jgi:hypothetical protein
MKLVCPCCGAVASAEAWENDAAARQALDLVTRLPGMVQSRVLPYLGLFRQGGRGLTWTRALRLLQEVHDMVEAGTVRWEGAEERPCPPTVWAAALDAVLARRPSGLKNHNYLRHVAWETAAGDAARAESDRERDRAHRMWSGRRPADAAGPAATGSADQTPTVGDHGHSDRPATEEERQEMQRMLREFLDRFGGRHE